VADWSKEWPIGVADWSKVPFGHLHWLEAEKTVHALDAK